MNIEQAKQLKKGDKVHIKHHNHGRPLDTQGVVYSCGGPQSIGGTTLDGTSYVWVGVRYNAISKSVFPSHCLSLVEPTK